MHNNAMPLDYVKPTQVRKNINGWARTDVLDPFGSDKPLPLQARPNDGIQYTNSRIRNRI